MRPAGKGPLDSLYFNYPIFPARRVAELEGATVRHHVAIVGAGPIGMTAALVLARYGIRSVLIDRKDTFNDGSRASASRGRACYPGGSGRWRLSSKGTRLEATAAATTGDQIFRLKCRIRKRKIPAMYKSATAVYRAISA